MRTLSTGSLVAVAALTLGLLATACAPAATAPAPAEQPAAPAPAAAGPSGAAPATREKPQYGGVFRYVIPNPRIGQDPHKTTGSSHFENYGRVYNTLLRNKQDERLDVADFVIAPELAERWESSTPTTWVITLQKGIKWHNIAPVNGREFVADDVVYSVNRLASAASVQKGYWLDLEKVEAVDKYTVKFTLKAPVAPFPTLLTLGYNKMVAREAVEAAGGDLTKGPLVGTGPWFVECTVDVECNFTRNPGYFMKDDEGNALPYLDKIQGLVMPDVQAEFAAFRAKQIDWRSLNRDERQIVERAQLDVVIRDVKNFGGPLVHFRMDKAPWNDVRVRTAVSKTINRQDLVDSLLGGKGSFYLNWPPPGGEDWYLSQDEFKKAYKQDIEGAKKLLAEAGYADGFPASFLVANYGVADVPRAELIAAHLAKIGIKVTIKVIDRPAYLTTCFTRHGTFEDMCGFAGGGPPEADQWLSSYFHSKGSRNSSYTNDAKLDQMIDAQRSELVPEKRKQILLDIQRYLLQMNYGLVLESGLSYAAKWSWVKNLSVTQDYPGYRKVDHIWIDQGAKKKLGGAD